jgi:hypothetical protein
MQKRIDASATVLSMITPNGMYMENVEQSFNAKWEHPQAFNLSSCDFALSSTRRMP